MSIVNSVLKDIDLQEKHQSSTVSELDFLTVKKSSAGFSSTFWIASLLLTSTFLSCMLYWEGIQKPKLHAIFNTEQEVSETPSNAVKLVKEQENFNDPVHSKEISSSNAETESKRQVLRAVQSDVSETRNHKALKKHSEQLIAAVNEVSEKSIEKRPLNVPVHNVKEKVPLIQETPQPLRVSSIEEVPNHQAEHTYKKVAIPLESQPKIAISNPKHEALYDKAVDAFSNGDLLEANRLVEESLYKKSTEKAHILKLRLMLMTAIDQVVPYIYEHKLAIKNSIELLAIYAQANQQLGQYENAQWAYVELTKREPVNVGWYLGLALTYEHLGKVENALEHYHKAILLSRDVQLKGFAQKRVVYLQTLL